MYKLSGQGCGGCSILFIVIVCVLAGSCVSIKKVTYFNDVPDTISTPLVMEQTTPYIDPKIESNDVLAITLQTITQNAGNAPITSNSVGTFNPLNGFLVDKNGYVELSLIGFVKVAGLTTTEARELIKQKAKEFYKDPVVNVRISNFDITVLGDVGRPGAVTSTSEKVSIIDAIALSGDLQLTAKRDNILLIRSDGNEKKFVRLDLNSKSIFQSPYYYLKQHDIVYVTANKSKAQSSDNTFIRNLGILSSVISLLSLIVVFKKPKINIDGR